MKKTLYTALATLIIGLVAGFFIGRAKVIVKETHTIEYRQGEPVKVK